MNPHGYSDVDRNSCYARAGSIPQQGKEPFLPHPTPLPRTPSWFRKSRSQSGTQQKKLLNVLGVCFLLKHTPTPPPLLKPMNAAFSVLAAVTSCSLTDASSSAPVSQSGNRFKIVSPGREPSD